MRDYSFKQLLKGKKLAIELAEQSSIIPKIDAKDRKIIFELAKDARIPIKALAKNIGVSREGTKYRIERLIKHNILQGFTLSLNLSKLGLRWHYVLLQLQNYTKEFEEKLTSFVSASKNIIKATKYTGNYDVVLEVCSYSLIEFDNVLREIRNTCSDHLRDYIVLLGLREFKYLSCSLGYLGYTQEILFKNKKKLELYRINELEFSMSGLFELDATDKNILVALTDNSRTPSTIIGKEVNLSNDGVIKRINKMIDAGIITKFMPIFNFSVFNLQWYTLYFKLKNITKERESNFVNYIVEHPYINSLTKLSGTYDYVCMMWIESPKQYNKIMNEISTNFSDIISGYLPLIGLTEYKYSEMPIELIKH
ncbi:Lrp/AsnC family transcriptional regulator [Candidatus Woesearchaeota archaeon]|nr:Lrp/AsnC family transcriptional regulator [Candidatus Woesearchaeota archaeon]